jgi:histone-lysine N-methyltransferase SETMAR
MISAYFSSCGFVLVEFLPMAQKYDSHFFTETVLLSIERKLAERRPKLQTTAAHLFVDNTALYTAKMSIERIEELGFILVPNPGYSPDLAPCDFFLFGHPKDHLEGKQFTREGQVISALREVVDKSLFQTFQNVMDDWQYQLRRCIQPKGKYLL